MEKYIGKKYKLKTSTDFDEYLKLIEVGFFSRKIVTALSPISVLKKNEDGSFTLSMSTPIRSFDTTFEIGVEFVEERPDGVKVKSTMTVEGDRLIQVQIEKNGRKSTHIREFTDEKLTVITTVDGWNGKCLRVYEVID